MSAHREQGPESTPDALRYPWRDLVLWTAAFAAVAGVLAIFMEQESGGVLHLLHQLAAWFGGGPKPEVVTYPIWGLAFVLWLIPSVPMVIALQVGVTSLAAAALFLRIRSELITGRTLLAVLFLTCVPWYATAVKPYPQGYAGAFAVLAILFAERAWRRGRVSDSVVSGLLFGLAQNFRSELVLFPLFCFGVVLVLRQIQPWRPMRTMGYAAAIALLCQVPWALHYRNETGHVRLTESTGFAAMYGALGQLPGNPWGIRFDDHFLATQIADEGHPFSWLSDEAGEVFRARFLEAVREHPASVPKVWAYRAFTTFRGPFYTGKIALADEQALRLDVLREKFKLALGVAPNQRQIQRYREGGVWEGRPGVSELAAFGYQLASQGLFAVFFALAVVGFGRTAVSGRLWRGDSILLALLAAPVVYKVALGILLSYRVDYMNGISLFCIPFVVAAFGHLGTRPSAAAREPLS